MRLKANAVPAILAFSPALLLPLIQSVVRPRAPHHGLIGLVLGSAPDFVVGFCFPFAILVRPTAWTERTAVRLFGLWAAFTAVALVLVEFLSPFGPNVFDPMDIVAGMVGVALAVLLFWSVLRRRLTYYTA